MLEAGIVGKPTLRKEGEEVEKAETISTEAFRFFFSCERGV